MMTTTATTTTAPAPVEPSGKNGLLQHTSKGRPDSGATTTTTATATATTTTATTAHTDHYYPSDEEEAAAAAAAAAAGEGHDHDRDHDPAMAEADQEDGKARSLGLPLRSLTRKGPPGGFDDTPLPDAPQGYTLRFTFHYAVNLPPADFNSGAADPYLTATLKGTQPRRHKEDPDLTMRTQTERRTLHPQWEAQWVVANVPPTGFVLKCRLYDEDYANSDDRLGNVTVKVPRLYEGWDQFPLPGRELQAKKRVMSKRALVLKGLSGVVTHNFDLTPRLCLSIEMLGKSDPPFAQMYTVGPQRWCRHFSPMIGRLIGTKVDADEEQEAEAAAESQRPGPRHEPSRATQKYDFQANEMQLKGPVPPRLYHRFVEFRPIIGSMFTSTGLRGKVLNAALHRQHARIYNFDKSTEWGQFEPCTEEASLQLLRLAHFDQGGRIFTYVLTLDGLLRFTETGHEFGIDLLSKHTMHSNVQTYIAYSGEFFIRRTRHPHPSNDDPDSAERTHPPDKSVPGGPPRSPPPLDPAYYQLIIDNESGTYRPEKSVLPELKQFLERNFPRLGVVAMSCGDDRLRKLKDKQRSVKKQEGRIVNMVMNNGSSSSLSSAESHLEHRGENWDTEQLSKREAAYAVLEDPSKAKEAVQRFLPIRSAKPGSTSR